MTPTKDKPTLIFKAFKMQGIFAGKTTFFLVCNGILKTHHGELRHFGDPVAYGKKQLMSLRKSVSIVFQDPENQLIASTVENEVSFGPMNLGISTQEVAKRVNDSLDVLNLQDFRKRATHTLSGGEKKRVTIADILAMEPDVMFLDEPTASLDPKNVKILKEILETLHEKGVTVVVSTHDIDFAYGFCDRALVFSDGQIIADDAIQTVFESDQIVQQSGIRKPILFQVAQLAKQGYDLSQLEHLRSL